MSFRDSPLVRQAREAMTPEQIQEYEEKGEAYHNNVNFETGDIEKQHAEYQMTEVARLVAAVRSGLHPDDLDIDEQLLLRGHYGDRWRSKV